MYRPSVVQILAHILVILRSRRWQWLRIILAVFVPAGMRSDVDHLTKASEVIEKNQGATTQVTTIIDIDANTQVVNEADIFAGIH